MTARGRSSSWSPARRSGSRHPIGATSRSRRPSPTGMSRGLFRVSAHPGRVPVGRTLSMLASRTQADELPVINMTPMVDVILCLLVFFMAATRLYDWDESEFAVNVPEVAEAAPLTAAPDDLILTIVRRGVVAVGESTYDL